jgi:RNA polymerase primary sigma factor
MPDRPSRGRTDRTSTPRQDTDRPPLCEGEDRAVDAYTGSFSHYLRDLAALPPLSIEQEQAYARQAHSGDAHAREMLVRHNLRFVVSVARRYLSHGVPIEDLVQDGNTGLLQAIASFDPDRGVPLIHYAAHSIAQAIRHGLTRQIRQVRIPANRVADLSRIQQVVGDFVREHGHHPEMGEIRSRLIALRADAVQALLAERLGRAPAPEEIEAQMARERTVLREETIAALLAARMPEVSMDGPAPSGHGASSRTLAEWIGQDARVEGRLEDESRNAFLDRLIARVASERDAEILRMVHGIGHTRVYTLEEIGECFGITRERVRQIRDRLHRQLREMPESDVLRELWAAH